MRTATWERFGRYGARAALVLLPAQWACEREVQPTPEQCDPNARFLYPNAAAAVSDSLGALVDDPTPMLSGDELTVYFHAQHNGATALYRATRTDRKQPFGRAGTLSGAPGGLAGVSTDGQRLYFSTGTAVRRAHFVPPDAVVPDADDEVFAGGITFTGVLVSANETVILYWREGRIVSNAVDNPPIYRRERGAGQWGEETDSGARGRLGAVSADGALLVADQTTLGGQQMPFAYEFRAGESRYGKPVRVGDWYHASSRWLSPDACRLYVSGSAGPVTGQPNHTINWLERAR